MNGTESFKVFIRDASKRIYEVNTWEDPLCAHGKPRCGAELASRRTLRICTRIRRSGSACDDYGVWRHRYAPDTDVKRSWGHSDAASQEAFLNQYGEQVSALLASHVVQGFCYTQLTDIETEENGLLFYDRRPKAPLDEIRRRTLGKTEEQIAE